MRELAGILLLLYCPLLLNSQIQINEVMSDNDSYHFGDPAEVPDWVELYNTSDSVICLSGWCLSDQQEELQKWCLPDTCLNARDYLVILASGGGAQSDLLQANFRLRSSGENLFLSDPRGQLSEKLEIPGMEDDMVFGKALDHGPGVILAYPTPGESNAPAFFYGERLISFDRDTYYFRDELRLNISGSDSCASLRVNLEGRTNEGVVIDGHSIELLARYDEESKPYFALQPTITAFKPPEKLEKHPHVTAHCLDNDNRIISSRSRSYIDLSRIESSIDLPVVFLEVKERDFFNFENGIMIPGQDLNYEKEGRDWERKVDVRIYDPEAGQVYSTAAGVRIHGHASRSLPQKSMKLYFRPEYGSQRMPGELLDRSFNLDRVLLRSFHSEFVGNEFSDFGFRDDVVMSIIRENNVVYAQHSRPCLVYLNGEFWGVYSLHEATDDDFIAGIEQITTAEIQLLEGAASAYEAARPILALDLDNPSDRGIFESYFDLENLTDYLIYKLFFFNTDWPHNNVKLWRDTASVLPYSFLFFDVDASFRFPSANPIPRLFSEAGVSDRYPPEFFRFYEKLLRSRYFVERLSDRYYELRKDILDPSNMLSRAREWRDAVRPHIREQRLRWHYPRDMATWDESFSEIENFLITRHLYFDDFIEDLASPVIYPNPSASGIVNIRNSERYEEARIMALDGRELERIDVDDNFLDLNRWTGLNYLVIQLTGPLTRHTEIVIFR